MNKIIAINLFNNITLPLQDKSNWWEIITTNHVMRVYTKSTPTMSVIEYINLVGAGIRSYDVSVSKLTFFTNYGIFFIPEVTSIDIKRKVRAKAKEDKKEIIDRLYNAWVKKPELRLGQLLVAAHDNNDVFYAEDYKLINEVEDLVQGKK